MRTDMARDMSSNRTDMTRLNTIQFIGPSDQPGVALVDGTIVRPLEGVRSIYELATESLATGSGLGAAVLERVGTASVDYDELESQGRLLPPVTHPVSPAHFLLTGTGLTHIGSATTRTDMHHGADAQETPPKSDSMRLFEQGLTGGKPVPGQIGAMPEWFYKGDAACLVAPGKPLTNPNFARSCAEEPEITGIYLVGPDGTPWRLGFTLANDLSDHETERQNFMYVAPSKLRDCALGPELVIGNLPGEVDGTSRVLRDGQVVWEGAFESGEDRMSYSIANLEHHHFRQAQFCRPGDLHAHMFGCPVMSFGDGFKSQSGDVFEFDIPLFGRPLRNPLIFEGGEPVPVTVKQL